MTDKVKALQSSRYILKRDDPRFKLFAGDVLECEPYALDPSDKLVVIRRVSDGFDPSCTVYRDQVERAKEQ